MEPSEITPGVRVENPLTDTVAAATGRRHDAQPELYEVRMLPQGVRQWVHPNLLTKVSDPIPAADVVGGLDASALVMHYQSGAVGEVLCGPGASGKDRRVVRWESGLTSELPTSHLLTVQPAEKRHPWGVSVAECIEAAQEAFFRKAADVVRTAIGKRVIGYASLADDGDLTLTVSPGNAVLVGEVL